MKVLCRNSLVKYYRTIVTSPLKKYEITFFPSLASLIYKCNNCCMYHCSNRWQNTNIHVTVHDSPSSSLRSSSSSIYPSSWNLLDKQSIKEASKGQRLGKNKITGRGPDQAQEPNKFEPAKVFFGLVHLIQRAWTLNKQKGSNEEKQEGLESWHFYTF